MYPSSCLSIMRSICCCRTRTSQSKITWELYMYSLGLAEQLSKYWEGQEQRKKKGKKTYKRIDQIEDSIVINEIQEEEL